MSRIKIILRATFTDNILLKVASLLSAMLIWIWVQNTQITTSTVRTKVNYIWPDSLVRVEDPIQSIILNVEGPQGRINQLEDLELYISVDISDGIEGINPVDFSSRSIGNLPQGIKVVRISPPAVSIELDKPMQREVDIIPNLVGSVDSGWEVSSIEVMPSTVTINGPQQKIENITSIQTEAISVDGFSKSTIIPSGLSLPTSTIQSEWFAPVQVKLRLTPLMITKNFSAIPVTVREQGWKTTVRIAKVSLRGPQNYMNQLDSTDLSILLSAQTVQGQSTTLDFGKDDNGIQVIYPPNENVTVTKLAPNEFPILSTP